MKKLCFVTAARSEYGVLKWLIHDVRESGVFTLQLIVTGAHLAREQGRTVSQILEDGFGIDAAIDIRLDTCSEAAIAESMGRMAQELPGVLQKLQPDYLVVLGDRYELLPVCTSAFVMKIPIIHISGGDVTEGAIDDGIRNAVTMLASYHFPGTEESARNIIRMRGSGKNVWAVGELGLDSFYREEMLEREALAKNLNIDSMKKWCLFTYHAETVESLEYNLNAVENCLGVLEALENFQVLCTYSNADFGGRQINQRLRRAEGHNPNRFIVIPSLGHLRYLSFMKQACFVIGNSSSGIVEAPFIGIPVVNIGNRQKGRHQCPNIIQCGTRRKEIEDAVRKALVMEKLEEGMDYWGDGHASEKILDKLCKCIRE